MEKIDRSRLREVNSDVTQAFDQVRSQVDELVESLDIGGMSRKLESFGREKPVVLAIAALTVGLAAGLLMRNRDLA